MELLKVGQKLSIYFTKDENLVEINCTISEVYSDRVELELPQYFMRYIEFLEEGKQLTAKVFSKVGTVDFNTMVISSPLEDAFSIELDYNAMKLTQSEEIPVIKSMLPMHIKQGDGYFAVKTFEISTEYLKFYTDRKFSVDATFDSELILPKNYGTISFSATVTEIDPVYDNEVTVSYSNMNENNRQALLYYMYLYSNNFD